MSKIWLTILTILTFSWIQAYSQRNINPVFDIYQTQFAKYPPELIYLQTSKDVYETGEDVWFKAYQLDCRSFGLSDKSKSLYLQMLTENDSIVWQEIYPVIDDLASGHIYLDEKLPEGEYFLNGFTRYSVYQNDSTGILPTRKIKVVKNIAESISSNASESTPDFKFTVFPEGGNLVSGIPSTLAFKATDGKGNPVDIKGLLYEENAPICEINTTHHGMGSITFTPLC
ncbi:MAG: hypothetical protein LUH15_19945 [Tannerellaceae bacterium]|nr:hypothetical protein [Tannerellaceae bacterium]